MREPINIEMDILNLQIIILFENDNIIILIPKSGYDSIIKKFLHDNKHIENCYAAINEEIVSQFKDSSVISFNKLKFLDRCLGDAEWSFISDCIQSGECIIFNKGCNKFESKILMQSYYEGCSEGRRFFIPRRQFFDSEDCEYFFG